MTLLIWSLYSILEGIREGFYWENVMKSNEEPLFNIHSLFTTQRLLVLLPLLWLEPNVYNYVSYFLVFSFLHNGSYYTTRGWISVRKGEKDPYPKRFFDQSNTSTALTTIFFTPFVRTILFLIAVLTQVIILIY